VKKGSEKGAVSGKTTGRIGKVVRKGAGDPAGRFPRRKSSLNKLIDEE